MGGSGSGRYGSCSVKQRVENCRVMEIGNLVRDGIVSKTPSQGSIVWTNTRTGERVASVGYSCTGYGDDWMLVLDYTITRYDDEKKEINLQIPLQITRPNFGGERWWFTCPLVVGGCSCRRKVCKLYLPPGGIYFGCRHCYNLTYKSCQESHTFDSLHALVARQAGCSIATVKRMFRKRY